MGIAELKESVRDLRRSSRGFITGLFQSSRSEAEESFVLRAQVLDGASYNLDYLLNAQKVWITLTPAYYTILIQATDPRIVGI